MKNALFHGQVSFKIEMGSRKTFMAKPQGNYGVALGFSDGHNTGIYTYEFLFSMR